MRTQDRVAQARVRGHQLGDDQVGPGPAHGDAQRVEQRRLGAGQDHLFHQLAAVRAHGLRRLHLRGRHAAHVFRHHQHHLEKGADEDDGDLGALVDAHPQHHQRNEGHRRHVADQVGQRLQQRLHRAERTDQQAQRQRDHRREHEARDHAVDADAHVFEQAGLGGPGPGLGQHRGGRRQKGRVHAAPGGQRGPHQQRGDQAGERQPPVGAARNAGAHRPEAVAPGLGRWCRGRHGRGHRHRWRRRGRSLWQCGGGPGKGRRKGRKLGHAGLLAKGTNGERGSCASSEASPGLLSLRGATRSWPTALGPDGSDGFLREVV